MAITRRDIPWIWGLCMLVVAGLAAVFQVNWRRSREEWRAEKFGQEDSKPPAWTVEEMVQAGDWEITVLHQAGTGRQFLLVQDEDGSSHVGLLEITSGNMQPKVQP